MRPYVSGKRTRKKYFYYRCSEKQKQRKFECPVAYTNADELEGQVEETLKKILGNPMKLKKIRKRLEKREALTVSRHQKELHRTEERIGEVDKEIDRLMDEITSLVKGRIVRHKRRIENLYKNLRDLEKRKNELTILVTSPSSQEDTRIVLGALEDFTGLYDSSRPTEKAGYLQRLLENVVVRKDSVTVNVYGLE